MPSPALIHLDRHCPGYRFTGSPAMTTANTACSLLRMSVSVVLACVFTACGGKRPTAPSQGAFVTFRVATESFRVHLVDDAQISAARRAQNGARANIPNGRIVAGTGVNVGWSWHLEDVQFVEVAMELCDGLPSDVQREGVSFGGGQFCPWTARLISIQED
jgi:hypothetical protein